MAMMAEGADKSRLLVEVAWLVAFPSSTIRWSRSNAGWKAGNEGRLAVGWVDQGLESKEPGICIYGRSTCSDSRPQIARTCESAVEWADCSGEMMLTVGRTREAGQSERGFVPPPMWIKLTGPPTKPPIEGLACSATLSSCPNAEIGWAKGGRCRQDPEFFIFDRSADFFGSAEHRFDTDPTSWVVVSNEQSSSKWMVQQEHMLQTVVR